MSEKLISKIDFPGAQILYFIFSQTIVVVIEQLCHSIPRDLFVQFSAFNLSNIAVQ